MKETPLPTAKEIQHLVSFLPRLYAEGMSPVRKWHGGATEEEGVFQWPWPEYEEVVSEFFHAASRDCWFDYGYLSKGAAEMLSNAQVVRNADLAQIKTMLTYCVRGERFCDGHWAAMIKGGHIRRLLERLRELV